MNTTLLTDFSALSLGLLIARIILGLGMAAHGSQKLFGWFGGYGLNGTGGFFESLGFHPGRFFAALAAFGEIGSGLLLAFGLLGPVGPALMLSVMIVAAVTVHLKGGFFAASNGIEMPLLYAGGAIALALLGPGAFSLDNLLGLTGLQSPVMVWGALLAGTIGAVGNLLARRQGPEPTKVGA